MKVSRQSKAAALVATTALFGRAQADDCEGGPWNVKPVGYDTGGPWCATKWKQGAAINGIEAWYNGDSINGIQFSYTNGAPPEMFGQQFGDKQPKLQWDTNEKNIEAITVWPNGKSDVKRVAAIEIKLSGEEPWRAGNPPKKTQGYDTPVVAGAGILMGAYGKAGGSIDSIAFMMVKAGIKHKRVTDFKFNEESLKQNNDRLKNAKPESIDHDSWENWTGGNQTYELTREKTKISRWSTTRDSSKTFGGSVGAKLDFGLPMIGMGGSVTTEFHWETTNEVQTEESGEKEEKFTFTVKGKIPKGEAVYCEALAFTGNYDLAYGSTIELELQTGDKWSYDETGVRKGVAWSSAENKCVSYGPGENGPEKLQAKLEEWKKDPEKEKKDNDEREKRAEEKEKEESSSQAATPSATDAAPTKTEGSAEPTKTETPDDEPTKDEPVDDEPADDEPVDDEPADDEPVDDEPVDDEPADDEPVDDEPADDEPVDDEPVDDEPVDDEPVDDEPADDEPVDDEPVDDEPADDEPVDDEPVGDEPVDDEPVDDEPVDDEPVDDEPVDDDEPLEDDEPVSTTEAAAVPSKTKTPASTTKKGTGAIATPDVEDESPLEDDEPVDDDEPIEADEPLEDDETPASTKPSKSSASASTTKKAVKETATPDSEIEDGEEPLDEEDEEPLDEEDEEPLADEEEEPLDEEEDEEPLEDEDEDLDDFDEDEFEQNPADEEEEEEEDLPPFEAEASATVVQGSMKTAHTTSTSVAKPTAGVKVDTSPEIKVDLTRRAYFAPDLTGPPQITAVPKKEGKRSLWFFA